MSQRVLRHIAIMQAALEPGAVVYRADRDDNRSADAPMGDEWERRDEVPTNFNWYKYDYRVVTPPAIDVEEMSAAANRVRAIVNGVMNNAYDNKDVARTLLRGELEQMLSKL